MAHVSEVVGKYSELAVRMALMANGWTVSKTETDEAYDLIGEDPLNGRTYKFQVKTILHRPDRKSYVIQSKNGQGEAYTKAQADYIAGVLATDGEIPRVFYFENTGQKEYWSIESTAAKRWIELPIALDRSTLTAVGGNKTEKAAI